MLSREQIEKNREIVIAKINTITRQGNPQSLIQWLDGSDFYYAPATTQYVGSYDGGLCEYCIVLYNTLSSLVDTFHIEVTEDSLILISLLGCLGKVNLYEKKIFNEKVYNEMGAKYDELGRYDWVSREGFTIRNAKDRYHMGTIEMSSYIVLSKFFSLTDEEVAAITYHSYDSNISNYNANINDLMSRYPLLTLLHIAHMYTSYIGINYE